jgi:hypothetical protein
MVKIISRGLLPRGHPIFSGGLETFSSPTSCGSFTTSPRPKAGVHPDNLPETEEDGILAEGLRRLRVRHKAQQGLWDQTKASSK